VAREDELVSAAAPARDPSDVVIYEMHVGGFTQHASSGVRHPGTFAGLIEKVSYLKELGITHVEFLPVMSFDEQDIPASAAMRGLRNYWGYNTYGFYAPHPRYCVDPAQATREFRDGVRALHEAGIGVLLDVVFNHTAEGGATVRRSTSRLLRATSFITTRASIRTGTATTRVVAIPSTAITLS
jgi:glycogen operon protein